jgi:hypothetical protein
MNAPSQNEEPALTKADIQEFIEIYKGEFGEVLDPRVAHEMASRLLELYKILYLEPVPDKPNQEPPEIEKKRSISDPVKRIIDIVWPKKSER